ncbi:hypothetical protein L227DRAFT_575913 [Lentinus tigrinus ALCF2SS1-6]|uniref:Uncharacterized protein n=1 Tax=Lentinus tigrinus ALCF2SS1-6 TaxID=1328759 RepID=A0A5C2SEZ5_9APHY|nr:hypothetical protein L227DRAFT_575913 [Lentinus tigrinus ALCF2SS1-6]
MPAERIEPEYWTVFYQYLRRCGVSADILRSFRRCVVPWPQGSACAYVLLFLSPSTSISHNPRSSDPVWVPDMLLLKLQLQDKERRAYSGPESCQGSENDQVPQQDAREGRGAGECNASREG